MGALIFAEKVAFSAIPNVNLNAVIIILATVFFGWRALCSEDSMDFSSFQRAISLSLSATRPLSSDSILSSLSETPSRLMASFSISS